MRERIREYFKIHRQELLDDIMAFIRIRSVNGPKKPGMPFGEENAAVLKLAKERAEAFGLKADILENYVAVIDLNDKPAGLDILAHLDVVPAGDGWTVTEPFMPVINDGRLYGRGSSDDKGPAIAALYAVRAVKELDFPVSKNARVILGADEETACRDTAYYYERYKEAPSSFSPDGEYPVINIEKGGLYTRYAAVWEEDRRLPRVICVKGGTAGNVVPGKAEAFIEGMSEQVLVASCEAARVETGVSFYIEDGGREDAFRIIAVGRSTHASTPWEGVSAVTGLMWLLKNLAMEESRGFTTLCALESMFPHGDFYGNGAGIAQMDEVSGALTLGTHMIDFSLTGVTGKIDCRAPLCASKESVLDVIGIRMADAGIELDRGSRMTPPHYVPEESSFVQTLLNCYEEVMEEPGHCMAIGGGTYAHHLENGVAFGCMKLGTDYHMHGANEYLIVEEIVKSAELFALVIARLCE